MMELERQNILFFLRTMEIGGTEQVVLQLCRILKDHVHKIVVCSSGGSYVSKLDEMHIKHYELPDIENKSVKTLSSTIKIVSRIIKEEEISVVHTHHRMAAFYARVLPAGNYIHVATAHNIFHNKRALTRFSYGKAHMIACGENVKENLVEYYGLENEHICVIHNSVDEYNADVTMIPQLQQWRDEGCFLVCNIGRLEEQKGMQYFIRSFPLVKEAGRRIKYVIVGDGSERGNLQELAKEMDSYDDILFMGRRDDVRNIMKQVDLVVLSSLWEGYPLVPIEAFSVGRTIVATRIEGTTEIISDGQNGILAKPSDPVSLADGIKRILLDPEKKKSMEKEAYRTYCDRYSFEVFSKRMIDFYKGL